MTPERPLIDQAGIGQILRDSGAGDEVAGLAEALSSQGVGVIDLGESILPLCDAVVRETDPMFGGCRRVHDAWRRSPSARRLAALPQVRRLLQLAYGREPFPFQTLSFRFGSEQGAHTDTAHFHSDPPGFMCGVWWALEDVEKDAGPLFYHPGSHRLPMPEAVNADTIDIGDRERAHMEALDRDLRRGAFPRTPALLRKGQAFVWTANLAHGGAPILRPDATRRSLVVHYYFKGCRYVTPIQSSGGKPMRRLPVDIATGNWVWPREDDGRRAPVSPGMAAVFLCKKLLRPMHRS